MAGLKNDTANYMRDQLGLRSKIFQPQSTAEDKWTHVVVTAQLAGFQHGYN